MSHRDAILEFRKKFKREFEEFPQFEYVFESMFNCGFSEGAVWAKEFLKDNPK